MAEETGFIRRWSRRKAQDGVRRHGGAQPVLPAAPVAEPADHVDPLARLVEPVTLDNRAVTREEAPAEESPAVDLDALPDIETLDDTSDYTPFMQAGVPDELRTKALKRLWQVDPLFNEVDGLVDYGEDFSISHKIAKSLYRVGKGMLTDEEHVALDADSTYVAPETDDTDAVSEEASETATEIEDQPAESQAQSQAESQPEETPPGETADQGKDSQSRPS